MGGKVRIAENWHMLQLLPLPGSAQRHLVPHGSLGGHGIPIEGGMLVPVP